MGDGAHEHFLVYQGGGGGDVLRKASLCCEARQQRSEMNDLKPRTLSWINKMKLQSACGDWLNLILYLTVKSPSCTSLSVA